MHMHTCHIRMYINIHVHKYITIHIACVYRSINITTQICIFATAFLCINVAKYIAIHIYLRTLRYILEAHTFAYNYILLIYGETFSIPDCKPNLGQPIANFAKTIRFAASISCLIPRIPEYKLYQTRQDSY